MASKRAVRIGLFDIEKEQFSIRRGLLGIVAIVAALVFLAIFGYVAIAAVLGAFVTAASVGDGSLRTRVERGTAVTVVGALLTVLGVWSGERGWTAAIVVALVTFAATLASVYGRQAATAAFVLNLWLLLSLTFTTSVHSSGALATNFLAGGALVVLLQPLRSYRERGAEAPPVEAATMPPVPDWSSPIRAALHPGSPVLQFALIRAGGIGAATMLGWYLFDNHPYWAAIVAFAITKSDPAELVKVGVHRTVGTIAGAAAATALIENVDSRPFLTAALVITSAAGIATQKVNYAAYTFFMTGMLILATQLLRGNAELAANQRAWATVLGVGLAFATTALVLSSKHPAAANDEHAV